MCQHDFITLAKGWVHIIYLNSSDVIHALFISPLGIKCDSTPGRTAGLVLCTVCSGCFSGQCSEICGFMHGHMPLAMATLAALCPALASAAGMPPAGPGPGPSLPPGWRGDPGGPLPPDPGWTRVRFGDPGPAIHFLSNSMWVTPSPHWGENSAYVSDCGAFGLIGGDSPGSPTCQLQVKLLSCLALGLCLFGGIKLCVAA